MDLGTIKRKLDAEEGYRNLMDFAADVRLVFDNAVKYNGPVRARTICSSCRFRLSPHMEARTQSRGVPFFSCTALVGIHACVPNGLAMLGLVAFAHSSRCYERTSLHQARKTWDSRA